ncbi:YbhN family protein [Paenibacillus sp. P36]|uniref:lysylphosphatidylglycerol synthase transmembrane domain-containing protein n=1 Tax=Paenibacillus sp. P36 TaxID=3342538 RepID=UPI0038B2C9DD
MPKKQLIRFIAILLVMCSLYLTWRWFNSEEWLQDVVFIFRQPRWFMFMTGVYLISFLFKAAAWRLYAGTGVRFGVYFHAISYSLLINHVLPIKAGDGVRAGLFMKHGKATWDEAFHSVAVMRLIDMLVLAVIGGIGIIRLGLPSSWIWVTVMTGGAIFLAIAHFLPVIRRMPFVAKHAAYFNLQILSLKGGAIIGLITLSWVLEAGVIHAVVRMVSLQPGAISLVWANSMTIAGQIFHITPGGIGTYESTMSGSLLLLGVDGRDAYRAALVSHTFKFLFAFTLGTYSLIRMPLHWHEIKNWIHRLKPTISRTRHGFLRKDDIV